MLLTNGLIGVLDTQLNGPDGQYPDVKTIGLRNLAGIVDGENVTLWATTAQIPTQSSSLRTSCELLRSRMQQWLPKHSRSSLDQHTARSIAASLT